MRRYVIAAVVMLLVAVGILGGREIALRLSASDAPGHAFTISGVTSGLVPGKPASLLLTVTNPDAQPIRLVAASASVAAAGAACPATLVTVTSYAGTPETIVPGRGQARVTLTITLSANASNACRHVTFPLTYTGKAEQWH